MVSFDVFDTLILRIVNTPETIFKLVGDVCGIKDYEHIRQEMQRQASMEAEENGTSLMRLWIRFMII